MSPNRFISLLAALALPTAALIGCSGSSAAPESQAPAESLLRVERVVMLMRHGVRPPTKARIAPEGSHDLPWPDWPVAFGELTPHGYQAIVKLAQWDRQHWGQEGLLPEAGCPWHAEVDISASARSRAQDTAHALNEGMFPGCGINVSFPADADEDVEFHPLDTGAVVLDAQRAMREAEAMLPPGGIPQLLADNADRFALLERALGCCSPALCASDSPRSDCSLADLLPSDFVSGTGGRPKVGELLGTASTISQTFLLQYLEGFPPGEVAWGRLSRDDIEALLEFHRIKFQFEARPLHVAAHAAAPLARRMVAALRGGPRLSVLVGHDTNIAQLGGLLDLHWQVPDYPRDDPPPGGALGFALFSTPDGGHSVRAFYRSQTMNQVRELQTLDGNNPAYFEYLPIPGCETPCRLEDFEALVAARIAAGD